VKVVSVCIAVFIAPLPAPDLAWLILLERSGQLSAYSRTDLIELIFADRGEVYVKTEMGGIGHGVFRHTRESLWPPI
jgi:hypothetical protein